MRMWEIREGDYSPKRKGSFYERHGSEYGKESEHKDHELKEAYECGFEDGYEEAMREIEGHHTYSRMKRRY